MNAFKLQTSLLVLVFLTGCLGSAPPASDQPSQDPYQSSTDEKQSFFEPPPISRDDNDYATIKKEDPDREEVLDKYSNQDLCKSEEWEHECYVLCKEMYKRIDDKEDCEALDKDTIDELYAIHELLKSPDYSSLTQSINLEYLEAYFNVSIAAFDRLIGDYNKSDAEEILIWIAEDEKIAELFSDADEDYKTLGYLLETATSSFDNSELDEPFGQDIDGNDTLFELAIGNEVALEWFQDYIFETATQCVGSYKEFDVSCFYLICQIGDNFGDDKADKDNQEDWVNNSSDFRSYLNEFLDYTNSNYVDTGNWVDDLCGKWGFGS